jgi:hypothetical protein
MESHNLALMFLATSNCTITGRYAVLALLTSFEVTGRGNLTSESRMALQEVNDPLLLHILASYFFLRH